MRTLFISDLHLSEHYPHTYALFNYFMTQLAPGAKTLYVLGDLFEFWLGDDDLTRFHQQVIADFCQLAATGVQLFFLPGNRDFLIGKTFCQASQMILLQEGSVIELAGRKTLLMHGDLLCTLDRGYQRYRAIAHQKWLQKLFLSLPLRLRRQLARKIHQQNPHQAHIHKEGYALADATQVGVKTALLVSGAEVLIHGHTHRLGIHYDIPNCLRIVLGDWHQSGNYLVVEEGQLRLEWFTLPLSEPYGLESEK